MLSRWLVCLALLPAACSFDSSGFAGFIAADRGKQPPPPRRDFRWLDRAITSDLAPPDRPPLDLAPPDLPPPPDHPVGVDLPSCTHGLTWCDPCVDLTTDHDHCGACNRPCGALTCCASSCVNTSTDDNNCGKCGNHCTAPNHCFKSTCSPPPVACASGTLTQTFGSSGMWGCKGTVQFKDRAGLCSTGFHVCSAAEWVSKHGTSAPTHIYWTNDVVYADDWTGMNCVVRLTPSAWCGQQGWPPMRVCPNSGIDAEANTCNWTGCGFQSQWPNQYFGGCEKDYTAGALCCS